jgi:toxin ParE1/3/4
VKRLKVTFRPDAISDLQDIYRIVFRMSLSHVTAARFTQRIMASARRIGNAPRGGRPRDDLETGLRTVPFERTAVIAYKVTDAVEITNVFYGGRDYEALYRKGKPDDSEIDE